MTLVAASVRLVAAQERRRRRQAVAGKWTMTVKGSPHGDATMGLALKQDGRKVQGTFASPHGEFPVEGTFADGTLELATKASGADAPQITFSAKLKDDDTLAGYLSSPMGDMTWTAKRVKDDK